VAIAAFNARHPGVSVKLRDTSAARIANAVLEGSADFGIGIGIDERALPELQTATFMTDRLMVVYPAEHALAGKARVTLSDLANYPIIALDGFSSVRGMLEGALQAAGHRCQPAHEVRFISTAVGMARAGLGITVVSSLALGRAVLTGLHARVIDYSHFNRDIVIVRRRGATLSPAAETLLECIRDVRDRLPSERPARSRGRTAKLARVVPAARSRAGDVVRPGRLTGAGTA
jgi:DNA-binding transcriptional LysR family regulator